MAGRESRLVAKSIKRRAESCHSRSGQGRLGKVFPKTPAGRLHAGGLCAIIKVMKHLIDCAMKRTPCDLVITNARIFNVFTGELECGDIAIADGRVAGIGKDYPSNAVYDAGGRIAIPGLIDSHIHIESSMLSPEAWASLAVPRGTTGVIADPHEIVNVCGVAGAEYIKEAFARLDCNGTPPLDVYLQLPSCVPATPFETSGAVIGGRETEEELARGLFFGLGEMMNFPAVIAGDADVLRKIQAAHALAKPVDGHAPGLSGEAFDAYRCAGVLTDHESLSFRECREKVGGGRLQFPPLHPLLG